MPVPEDFMLVINHNTLVRDAHFLAFCCCFANCWPRFDVVTSLGDSYKLTNHKTFKKSDLEASFSLLTTYITQTTGALRSESGRT